MDFSSYTNSIRISDQSGEQQAEFLSVSCKIDIQGFWKKNDIKSAITPESREELFFQAYNQNLFGVSRDEKNNLSTTSCLDDKKECVWSRANGSLTYKELDYDGYETVVMSYNEETKTSLWNALPSFKKMVRKIERKKRGYADVSNVYLSRDLRQKEENFFLFTNDKEQINQANFEGYKYLRPVYLLVWMVADSYIKRQKAIWAYEKMKNHNLQWVEKGVNFKDIYKNLTQ